jgi:hypothetical protein
VSKFAELFTNASAAQAKAEMVEAIQANVEGWEPRPGRLDDWKMDAVARLWSIAMQQASSMGAAALQGMGRTILNIPPVLAAPATVTSTWTLVDDDGHTIEDGTEVKVAVPGGKPAAFIVVGDVVVAPGDEATDAGEVLLQAIEPGEGGNGLTGEATPTSTNTIFVDSIALVGASSGGVDEEDEDAYLDRLTEALQLLSLSLIVPRDFEIDARAVAGIERALCVPGYDPAGPSEGNALMLCMFPLDAAGASSSAPVKAALQERQQAKVPSGVLVKVGDATHTLVHAVPALSVLAGHDAATVKAAGVAFLNSYLSPANWPPSSSNELAGFDYQPKAYFNELIAQLDRVTGVDRVVSLLLGSGTGKAFTVAAATDKLTSAAHGFANGDAVLLRTGLTPGLPLAAATVYYVRDVEANSFKLTATVGGGAVNVTTDGSGSVVKVAAADITLPGVAPLTEPGEIVLSAS